MRRLLAVICALLAVVLTSAAGWPTDHGDNLRSGYNPSATPFGRLTAVFSRNLDGAVYGSPIMAGANIIVATENNTVYALNAATGGTVWSRHLRTAIADTSVLACAGNIRPTGITSTPAYDPVTGRIFIVTITNSAPQGVHHEIWALNAGNGAVAFGRQVEVPGTDPRAQQQRAALAVDRGRVYISFGGLAGDCGNYKGAVISLPTSGQFGGLAYVVPTPREGAVWAAGGPVVAPDGSLFIAVGNGESTTTFDFSDSVTRLSPAMTRLDYFAPTSWAADNQADADLGSMSPAYLLNGYILQAGKSGNGYTLRTSRLGGIGGQVRSGPLCRAFGVAAVTTATAYLPCTDGVSRVDVAADGSFSKRWTASGISGSPVAGPGALYALGGSTLYALSGRTGTQLGSINVGPTTRFATPALIGNRLYVGTVSGIVAVRVG